MSYSTQPFSTFFCRNISPFEFNELVCVEIALRYYFSKSSNSAYLSGLVALTSNEFHSKLRAKHL